MLDLLIGELKRNASISFHIISVRLFLFISILFLTSNAVPTQKVPVRVRVSLYS